MARHLTFDDGAWFHVTNRGVAKQEIFRREPDYFAFLDCLGRHLGQEPARDLRGRPYVWLGESLKLSSYGLIPNHFHLLARDDFEDGRSLRSLLHASQTGYAKYFNRKYDRDGPLYKSSFHTERIESLEHLKETVSYIHLNLDDDPRYRHCSHREWVTGDVPEWLNPAPALDLIGGPAEYDLAMTLKLKKRSRLRVSEAIEALSRAEQRLARVRAQRFSAAIVERAEREAAGARSRLEIADSYRQTIADANSLDDALMRRDEFRRKARENPSNKV